MIQVRFLPTLPSLLAARNVPLIHRDLSWLQFNERVLAEARQAPNPLLERVKFLAISASNLDEFFMIRFGSLIREIASKKKSQSPGKPGPRDLRPLLRVRASVLESVSKFNGKQMEALDLLTDELQTAGIRLVRGAKPGDPAHEAGRRLFDEQILPHLGPPEAFSMAKLSTLENLQLAVLSPGGLWFRIPRSLPQILWTEREVRSWFFTLDDLLLTHLNSAFRINGPAGLIRITRDSDVTVDLEEEDTESIPDVIRSGLGSRDRGRPVRLQYRGTLPTKFLAQATAASKLIPAQVFPAPHTLCLQGLWTVVNRAPSHEVSDSPRAGAPLRHPPLPVHIPRELRDPAALFERLRERDWLLHHPYDSFDSYVAWIQAACADPLVESIEQTVYRMDTLSPVLNALKSAAARKKVRVIIELRARFDELNNLRLADELRKAGVEVAFGFGKLKLHAKVALVTRNEAGQKRLYTHLSTGNYNATTARQYTDLAILTANAEVGADARTFFDAVWKGELPQSFRKLVMAPTRLHRRLLSLIHAETEAAATGKKARIVAKVNALVDPTVIESLYRASRNGVQVDLIVRGACSLIPGVKGLSENIRVISVVDRFLEHSRLYYFASSRNMYLSSADWMPRNFFSRLEIAFPVLDPRLYKYLEEVVIPTYLGDTVKAKELTLHGTWKKRSQPSGKPARRSQFVFAELAAQEYLGTPLEYGDTENPDPDPTRSP